MNICSFSFLKVLNYDFIHHWLVKLAKPRMGCKQDNKNQPYHFGWLFLSESIHKRRSNQLIFKKQSPSLPNLFITYKHKIKPNYQWNRAAISYYINEKDMMLIYLEDTMCIFLFHYHEKHPWQFHKFLHIMFVHVLYGFHARNIHVFPSIINVAPKPSINIYGFHVASKIDNAFLFWMNWQKFSSSKISTFGFYNIFLFFLSVYNVLNLWMGHITN